jgi:hypothetical protein
MKGMTRTVLTITGLLAIFSAASLGYSAVIRESSFLVEKEILPGALKMLPVTTDFRNYFVLQSFASGTSVLIGDFSGADKVISLSTDANGDGKLDKVIEYYPDTVKTTYPAKSSSQFFDSFDQTADDIINGKIFNQNYSYKMLSINTLKDRLKSGKDIFPWGQGFNVKIYDPDNTSTIQGEYFFSRKDGAYTLIFKTYYYKLYKTKITPPLYYSVCCKDTRDPKIKAIVDDLYKTRQ